MPTEGRHFFTLLDMPVILNLCVQSVQVSDLGLETMNKQYSVIKQAGEFNLFSLCS